MSTFVTSIDQNVLILFCLLVLLITLEVSLFPTRQFLHNKEPGFWHQ